MGWEPEDLPRLGRLEITSALFFSVTMVPSLHTVILTDPALDMTSLSRMFAALEECPALAVLRLQLTHRNNAFHNKTPERVLDFPNLRHLAVGGGVVNIQFFLSAISFPSATFVELNVADTDNEQDRGLVLPNVLPRRFPVAHPHQMLAGIDRLCFRSNVGARTEREVAIVVMRAYAQGAERLRVTPAFWLHSASHFLQILPLFRECSITELALDLRRVPADVEGECWAKVFTALPDVRRLEMLSPRMGLREMKRDIATHYLASCRVPELAAYKTNPVDSHRARVVVPPRRGVSLAWVLGALESPSGLSQMEAELHDIEQVLRSHVADTGSHLERLELYVADSEFHRYEPGPLGTLTPQVVTRTDDRACQLVTRDYICRLEAMADVVVVGGRRDLWTMMRKTKIMDENECYPEDDDDELEEDS